MLKEGKEAEIIVPVSLVREPSVHGIAALIVQQHEQYGIKRFALSGPGLGYRSKGFPDRAVYERLAETFSRVRELVGERALTLGWWCSLNLKSGRHADFQPVVKANGEEHPFANCPSCARFRERYVKNVAAFCSLAKPDFVILEDDYCISAAAGKYGCFCPNHLAEFAKREGHCYEREELVTLFEQRDAESVALLKRYKSMLRDSMVTLSAALRQELDKETPEIPVCLAQSGAIDADGDATVAVCRALAGKHHTPLCRFYGAYYNGGEIKNIPELLYHAIHCRQHIEGEFGCYHESDPYPHTRFFTSARMMKAYLGITYSQGFIGSVFQTLQLLDHPVEETAYGEMLQKEHARLGELIRTVAPCTPMGVEVPYDPFYNVLEETKRPLWLRALTAFGIPFVTTPAKTAFLDETSAKYLPHEELMRYFSGNLFLDGDAAYALTQRGYGRYMGVTVGENAVTAGLQFDFGAKEVLCPPFDQNPFGKAMPAAHTYAHGKNGIPRSMTPVCKETEVVSELVTSEQVPVTPAMTRFANELGGRVVVMGMTLRGNESQSLLNYRRMWLFDQLLLWGEAELPFVKGEPYLHLIANKAEKQPFSYQLTLINLGEDAVCGAELYLPQEMRGKEVLCLTAEGLWKKAEVTVTQEGMVLHHPLALCEPLYLKLK